jgi:hypothetical protein
MAKVKITYEFDYYEEGNEMRQLVMNPLAVHILFEIDEEIRSKLKHGSDDWLETKAYEYLESIREKIYDSGALREYV